MKTLDQISCQYLKGVGPRLAKLLEKCQVFTIQDVLFHLPYRYQDRTRITKIRYARPGEWIVIEGVVQHTEVVTRKKGAKQFRCYVNDTSGVMSLLFFHIAPIQKTQLQHGTRLRCFGEVRYSNSGIVMVHPEYQLISDQSPPINQIPIHCKTL
jgi:ATP-dependent DNA helicase RecG